MILLEDQAQQDKKHLLKHSYWEENEVELVRVPLPVGDYILMNDKVADVIKRKGGRKKIVGRETVVLKNGNHVERNIYDFGVPLKKMDFVGTYKVAVDTKNSIEELLMDVCGPSHDRFRDECILAQNNGIKLYILVENKGCQIKGADAINPTILRLEDLHSWKNPRLFLMEWDKSRILGYYKNGGPKFARKQKYPKATRGIVLQKACMTMTEKYGVEFLFCRPEDSGKRVMELLSNG